MRGLSAILGLWLSGMALVCGQARFPMKYLDEVGHLGDTSVNDHRKSANLVVARVFREGEGSTLRFEGRDLAGKPSRLWLPGVGGVGWTDVWMADFDHNGQRDLLIGTHFPGNGRCVNGEEITILMFDARGRPIPWTTATMLPNGSKYPYVPAILRDVNRDGRAEVVTTGCEPGGWPGEEHWRITGVYEARDARWIPLKDVTIVP
jgi:hypothetical protein